MGLCGGGESGVMRGSDPRPPNLFLCVGSSHEINLSACTEKLFFFGKGFFAHSVQLFSLIKSVQSPWARAPSRQGRTSDVGYLEGALLYALNI